MVNLEKETAQALSEKLPASTTVKEVIDYLFERNLVDKKKCQYALIKRHYFEVLQTNPDLKSIDAKQITADDFGVSLSQVDKSLYYYTRVEL